MSEDFIAHTKKIQIISWKRENEIYPSGTNKLVKTTAVFFKDLLPGDIIEFSFSLKSTGSYKAEMAVKAWRGNEYLGARIDSFNKIVGPMYSFNLKEID